MKKIYKILILLLLLIPIKTKAIIPMSDKVFVTDGAEILTEDSENYIVQYSDFLYKVKQIDFFVVTTDDLEGMTIEDYTSQIYKDYRINKKGLLIVVATDKRQIRVQAGQKLMDIIDSSLIDYYIETYFMPFFKNDEWDQGIINGYSAFYKYICTEYDIDASQMFVVDHLDIFNKYRNPILIGVLALILLLAKHYNKYFYKMKKRIPLSLKEFILVLIMVISNIFALSVAFIIKPIYLLLVFLFELLALYLYKDTNKNVYRVRKKKRKKK